MELTKYELSQIKSYLDAVRPRLSGPEGKETLEGIESHIHAAIEARRKAGEQGNLVAAVLAELDSPEQYGPTLDDADRSGLTMYGLVGACLLPLAIPVIGHVVQLTPFGDLAPMPAFYKSTVYQYVLLPLGVVGPLVGMVLGWAGIQECRRTGGAVYGLPLAVIALVGAPLVGVNLFALIVCANIAPPIGLPIVMIAGVLALYANVCVIRFAIKKVASPV